MRFASRSARRGTVPVLMLSARTLLEDRIRGFDVGADQYLQKPFDLDELLSIVRNLLGRRIARRPPSPVPRASRGPGIPLRPAVVNFDTFK